MQNAFFSGVAASFAVLAAPALMLYAHSDVGQWSSSLESWISSPPVALSISAFAYVVVLGITQHRSSWLRVIAAALLCLVIPTATMFFASPLLFVMAEVNASSTQWGLVAAVLSLPTAAAQVATLSQRKWRLFEFLAYPTGAVLLFVIPAASSQALSYLGDATLFALWPKILAAAPFAGLAALASVGTRPRYLLSAFIIVLTPFYVLKAAIDGSHGFGWKAAIWPARVATDFVGAEDRFAAWKQAQTRLLAGEPVCIGKRRFRFNNVTLLGQSGWSTSREPGCLTDVVLMMPAEALELSAIVHGRVALEIRVPSSPRQRASAASTPSTPAVDFDDLTARLLLSAGSSVPPEQYAFVRDNLLQFIRNARL